MGEAMDYDVLIVGSGFGGSVAALRLSEKGYRVAVLEQGRRIARADIEAADKEYFQAILDAIAWVERLLHPGFFPAHQRRRRGGGGRRQPGVRGGAARAGQRVLSGPGLERPGRGLAAGAPAPLPDRRPYARTRDGPRLPRNGRVIEAHRLRYAGRRQLWGRAAGHLLRRGGCDPARPVFRWARPTIAPAASSAAVA